MHTTSRRSAAIGICSSFPWGSAIASAAIAALSGCAINLSCPAPIVNFPAGAGGGAVPVASVSAATPSVVQAIDPAVQMIAQLSFKTTRPSSLDVDAESLGAVQEIARSIRKGRIVPITVRLVGYADPTGAKSDANAQLSARRVNAVRNLLERMDVDTALVRTEARGGVLTDLCAGLKAATLDECLRLNRRVEIIVDGIRPPKVEG